MTKFTLNNSVLRLTLFTVTTILLKIKLKVNIYLFILFLFHIYNPYYKHDLNSLILISKMRRRE